MRAQAALPSRDTEDRTHSDGAVAAPRPEPEGPFARLVVAALAVGAAVALLLVLVVFAASSEARITGGALTGFSCSWLLIRTLTTRFTRVPQGWAWVPAVSFGGAGLAMVVCDPGAGAMNAVAWAWPPLVAGLVAWTWWTMRRAMPRRGRRVLVPVLVIVLMAAAGAAVEDVAQRSATVSGVPGERFAIGTRHLHLDCVGPRPSRVGSPTVVLLNGLGGSSASWARVTSGIARAGARVCAYDRAGQGWSDPTARPQGAVAAADDLHAVLAAAGEAGPFVLTGHSTGGPYAMTYAHRYPQQVAGMVLLDSSSPDQATRIQGFTTQLSMMRRVLALVPSLYRLGIGHVVPGGSRLPEPAADRVDALASTPAAARNLHDEQAVLLDVLRQAKALRTLGDRPLAVLTASDNAAKPGWAGAQDALTELSSNVSHVTVRSSHEGLLEDPAPTAESIRAISRVVAAVRTGRPVEP